MSTAHDQTYEQVLGERLRAARADKDWSRNDLAYEVRAAFGQKISPDVIGDYERGERSHVDVRHIQMMAAVLDVDPDSLTPPITFTSPYSERQPNTAHPFPAAPPSLPLGARAA